MDEMTLLQAQILRALSHPRRIEIIHRLAGGPIEVGRLAEVLGASQPNVSQHLAALRGAGLVEAVRDGRGIRYRLSDPDVLSACGLMRAVLQRRLARLGGLAAEAAPDSAGTIAPAGSAEGPPARSRTAFGEAITR